MSVHRTPPRIVAPALSRGPSANLTAQPVAHQVPPSQSHRAPCWLASCAAPLPGRPEDCGGRDRALFGGDHDGGLGGWSLAGGRVWSGEIVAVGTPEQVVKAGKGFTGGIWRGCWGSGVSLQRTWQQNNHRECHALQRFPLKRLALLGPPERALPLR